jgi:hypothetical protein
MESQYQFLEVVLMYANQEVVTRLRSAVTLSFLRSDSGFPRPYMVHACIAGCLNEFCLLDTKDRSIQFRVEIMKTNSQ